MTTIRTLNDLAETLRNVIKSIEDDGVVKPDIFLQLSLMFGLIETDCLNLKIDNLNGNKELVSAQIVDTLKKDFLKIANNNVEPVREFADFNTINKISNNIHSVVGNIENDRLHTQFLYNLLNVKKLDCFGMAWAVLSACRVLNLNDVGLMLSEDHAWIIYGPAENRDYAEVAWRGKEKATALKRGKRPSSHMNTWLYMKNAMECDERLTLAALVSAICPILSKSKTSDYNPLLVTVQKTLLWILYDHGYLKKYPMGLANLADLESQIPTPGKPSHIVLGREAIQSSKDYYDDRHVYPYLLLGNLYFHQQKCCKEGLECYADMIDVLRTYNYSSQFDDEIYKEVRYLIMDYIPEAFEREKTLDTAVYAHILRIFDGLCKWEERGASQVIGNDFVKSLVTTVNRFSKEVRRELVKIEGKFSKRLNKIVTRPIIDPTPEFHVILFSQKMKDCLHLLEKDKIMIKDLEVILTAASTVKEKQRTVDIKPNMNLHIEESSSEEEEFKLQSGMRRSKRKLA